MVRNVFSLRALFRNASCMFCACFSMGASFLKAPRGTRVSPRAGGMDRLLIYMIAVGTIVENHGADPAGHAGVSPDECGGVHGWVLDVRAAVLRAAADAGVLARVPR